MHRALAKSLHSNHQSQYQSLPEKAHPVATTPLAKDLNSQGTPRLSQTTNPPQNSTRRPLRELINIQLANIAPTKSTNTVD